MKVTRSEPWYWAQTAQTGIGYDLQSFGGRARLIVAGLSCRSNGPVGHSDGDVLAHAVLRTLVLGAAGLGDSEDDFPGHDPKWKGANSMVFLKHAKHCW